VRVCRGETLKSTEETCEECKAALEELYEIIRKYLESDKTHLVDRLKWPYVEKKVNVLRVNLDRLKSGLILLLEVIKYATSIKMFAHHDLCYPASVDKDSVIKDIVRESAKL